ncbi:MAG: cyclic nucleotide-binding domain-containing protein [Actinomycetota bacterium]
MTTREIHDLLKDHPFFEGLDREAIEFIAGCGSNVHFAEGRYIAREGDPAGLFYVVRSGLVALEISSPDRGPLVVDTVGEAEILGVSWLFPPYRWQFDARAVEPGQVRRRSSPRIPAHAEARARDERPDAVRSCPATRSIRTCSIELRSPRRRCCPGASGSRRSAGRLRTP